MMWAAPPPEPPAGWGNLVGLAVACLIFFGLVQLNERVLKPFRARQDPARKNSPALPGQIVAAGNGRGYLYVIQFGTGIVKVGMTGNPPKRLDRHSRDAAALGTSIVERWVSPAHAGYSAAEDDLIKRCAAEGRQIKREYFSGLPFARAVELAGAVVAEREGRPVGRQAVAGRILAGLLHRLRPVVTAEVIEATPVPAAVPTAPAAVPAPIDDLTGWAPPGEHGPALQRVLDHNGVDGRVSRCVRGPASTRYEITLQPGASVERVRRLSSSLAAACLAERVEVALVPGRGTVGIEVANVDRDDVDLDDVLADATGDGLILGLGRSIDGVMAPDLRRMPHLLIAGTSGAGKSSVINACICSLLRRPPDRTGLVLIDPLRVELAAYARVPHLAMPIVTEARHAAGALEWATKEMAIRAGLFTEVGVKDLDGYNRKVAAGEAAGPALRELVVVVDELGALMDAARDDVENPIVAIAESGRKYGVHLILATQRPTAGVVTGRIKANMPARLALTTTSMLESRIILDRNGAETLQGRGDALLLMPGMAMTRIQCSLVKDDQVAAAVAAAGAVTDLDQLRDAARIVVEVGAGSTSMLQTRMRLGWPKARWLLTELEARGVVGPADGNRPRDVLIAANRLDEVMRSWR